MVIALQSGSGLDAWRAVLFHVWAPWQSPWGGSTRGLWDFRERGDKPAKVASKSSDGTGEFANAHWNVIGRGPATGDQKRRSRAVSGGSTTEYRYDHAGSGPATWNMLNEEDGSETLQAIYVHDPKQPRIQIHDRSFPAVARPPSTGDWAYPPPADLRHTTSKIRRRRTIGSTRGLWDDAGDRLGKYEYTPFGGKYADAGADITGRRSAVGGKFTGHDWDQDARLYYTAYRYYSPDANRWLTRDPLGMVDGPNVYAYVVNNPIARWDVLGQFSMEDSWGLAICVGGINATLFSLANTQRHRTTGAAAGRCGVVLAAWAVATIGGIVETFTWNPVQRFFPDWMWRHASKLATAAVGAACFPFIIFNKYLALTQFEGVALVGGCNLFIARLFEY